MRHRLGWTWPIRVVRGHNSPVDVGPGSLPAEVSSFVGRAEDRARCADLLAASRLLCLTGVGGAGKSRLARQVARDVADRFPDGVGWADLEPCADVEAIVSRIAAVGPQARDVADVDSLVAALAPRTALLVLDGCEHLAEALQDVVVPLLRGARVSRN